MQERDLIRSEEEFRAGAERTEAGRLRVRKDVETREAAGEVPRRVERIDRVERVPADEQDSGRIETLEDGSISIPILEEQLVVEKRTVVRERVIVRKSVETETKHIRGEVRRERVHVDREPPQDA